MELITSLRKTVVRLRSNSRYEWGHMGFCNCGHLAQTLTDRSPKEIHQSAMVREGDWLDQVREYCPTSGLLIDDVIGELIAAGLTTADIGNLERLRDPKVLERIPDRTHLIRNNRDDLILYLETWGDLLESEIAKEGSTTFEKAA